MGADDDGQDGQDDKPKGRRRGFSDAMRWYGEQSGTLAKTYESIRAEDVHRWLVPLLPEAPAAILDIGAGTGRDAAWLASLGHDVVAVEPSPLRQEAIRLHPSDRIQWLDDSLPVLDAVYRLGRSFDLILLSAVWMHVAPADRARAFRKLVNLLRPGGAIAFTLRQPVVPEVGMHPADHGEIDTLARQHGAFVQTSSTAKDSQGRAGVSWQQVLVRLPDDGTGALPFLRHVILNDDKASTYKLALLRVVCRIAQGTSGYARERRDGLVALPLGLVGLYWLRLYLPLLVGGMPQTPTNSGLVGLGFVRDGFRALTDFSARDLRVGLQCEGQRSAALHAAIADACRTITKMPAHYLTFADGKVVFPVTRSATRKPAAVRLDEAYFASFGEFLVPSHLWHALQRYDAWIEPALIFEWARLMRGYARSQGRTLDEAKLIAAMTWSEPDRDVQTAKAAALQMLERQRLYCVWTGKRLTGGTVDIDHCVPWSAWPCDDLWNLMPADRRVNQNKKRDRLPSRPLLLKAQDRILSWWEAAYCEGPDERMRNRFVLEAKASLQISDSVAHPPDVFSGLEMLQARLLRDHQLPVWDGDK